MLEFPHGYTYSGHPVACAAGIAALDLLLVGVRRILDLPLDEARLDGRNHAAHAVDAVDERQRLVQRDNHRVLA